MSDFETDNRTRLHVDVVSDVVCPWCPIGEARLRKALERLTDELSVEIEWHPFVLNPDVPADGREMLPHLAAKYGRSETEMRASQQQIVAAAQADGLSFARATERRSWNTFDVHRVLAWAKREGCDAAFNHALFEAYFGRAENPTDRALLRDIAASNGLDVDTVDVILDGDDYRDEVDAELAHYRSLGVSAVPSFILDGRYLVSGAQDPDTLVRALRQVAARDAA